MNSKSLILLTLGLLYQSLSFAAPANITCQVVMKKSPAWSHFDLSVTMNSFSNKGVGSSITTFTLPKATGNTPSVNMATQNFDCKKFPQFVFTATFTPAIWHTTTGQPTANVFNSQKVYDISSELITLPANANQLTITVNFPNDFGVNEDPSLLANPPKP